MSELEFEAESHTYTMDGKRIPSVTQVLEVLNNYDMVPEYRLKMAAERGSAVHEITELYDYGTLSDFDEVYKPYLDGWVSFLDATKFEIEFSEYRTFHPKLRYAGTIDRIGRTRRGKRVVIDIKTTYALLPAVGPQTAAYLEAFNQNYPDDPARERWGVYLKPDGSFRKELLKGPSDMHAFRACLAVANWREKHYG